MLQTGQQRRFMDRRQADSEVLPRRRRVIAQRCRRAFTVAALAAGALLVSGINDSGPGQSARAQQLPPQGQYFLNVAPVTLAEPASRSPFPIQVGPIESLVRNSFVRIRGLPTAATLTEGHSISPGAWAVPLAGLATLGIVLPVGLQQGRWDVVVALVTIEGTVLTDTKTALVVGPVQLIAPQPKEKPSTSVAALGSSAATPPLEAAPPPAATPPQSPERDRALGLYAKGKELLGQGNIQPARMLFRRAAEAGLAESALALGGTYDPVELAKQRVIGLQPDIAAARQWYDKARQLGAPEAAERLRRLESR
jgi:hypothetical protein